METLTKQEFWAPMKQKYPKAMEDFLTWVDGYKKDNNWSGLFTLHYRSATDVSQPKFHDLPVAMQFGIWVQYVGERSGEAPPDVFVSEMKKLIMEGLEITDEELQ